MSVEREAVCTKPPEGWYCTRGAHHVGPCAALPTPERLNFILCALQPTLFEQLLNSVVGWCYKHENVKVLDRLGDRLDDLRLASIWRRAKKHA